MNAPAIFHDHREADVVHDGGIAGHLAEDARVIAFIAGFLAQLAQARAERRGIFRVHHPTGDFEFDGVGAVAILLHHHELPVRCDGDEVDPVDRINDVKVMLLLGAG